MTDTCSHIVFGDSNYIEISTLSSNVAPANDINFLKNDDRAEQTRFTNLSEDEIVIEAVFEEVVHARYFAIAGSNLPVGADIKLEVYATATSNVDVLQQDFHTVGEMIPLGMWRAGIDPYDVAEQPSFNNLNVTWFDSLLPVGKIRLRIRHGYGYVPPNEPPPVIVGDGTFRQGTNGVLSMEAESGDAVDEGLDSWAVRTQSGASGGSARYKTGNEFYGNPNEGPRINFEFTASRTGTMDVWGRFESTDGNSLYTIFDGNSKTSKFQPIENFRNQGWQWKLLRQIYVTAESKKIITIAARDHYMSLDKIIIQPAGSAAPSGTGAAESSEGTKTVAADGVELVTASDNVSLRMLILGDLLRMDNNFSYGSSISFLTEPELVETSSGFNVSGIPQQRVRRASFNLDSMSDNDRLVLSRMETRLAGKSFLLSGYPDRQGWFTGDYLFLGKFANALQYSHFFEDIHQTSLNIFEV